MNRMKKKYESEYADNIFFESSESNSSSPIQISRLQKSGDMIVDLQFSQSVPLLDGNPYQQSAQFGLSKPDSLEESDLDMDMVDGPIQRGNVSRRSAYTVMPNSHSNQNKGIIEITPTQQHATSREPSEIRAASSRASQLLAVPISSAQFRTTASASAPSRSNMEHFLGTREFINGDHEANRNRKKLQHNAIERRRRIEINNSIAKLANLLPDSFDAINKRYKGTTLKASCDYVKHLQAQQEKWVETEKKNKNLLKRLQELEQILHDHRIAFPPDTFTFEQSSTANHYTSLENISDRTIKQETNDAPSPAPNNTNSINVASQLSEMAITSPTAFSGPSTNGYEQENAFEKDVFFSSEWLMNDRVQDLFSDDSSMQNDPILTDISWDQSNFSPDSQRHSNFLNMHQQ